MKGIKASSALPTLKTVEKRENIILRTHRRTSGSRSFIILIACMCAKNKNGSAYSADSRGHPTTILFCGSWSRFLVPPRQPTLYLLLWGVSPDGHLARLVRLAGDAGALLRFAFRLLHRAKMGEVVYSAGWRVPRLRLLACDCVGLSGAGFAPVTRHFHRAQRMIAVLTGR